MNFRKNVEEGDGMFQIAPMIDIVFIMLTFFVAVFGMQQTEREMEVRPPVSSSGTVVSRTPYDIVINVKQDGSLTVNRRVWTIAELRDRLQMLSSASGGQTTVLIRADALTIHQNVVTVMDACMSANINRFSFLTIEKDGKAK